MCVFPLLEDKQRFKFEGMTSILYTHFILMFCLGFGSFMIYVKPVKNLNLNFS